VVVAGRRQQELESTCTLAGSVGMHAIQTDVSDETSVARLFEFVDEHLGRIDLLLNNAGCGAPAVPMEELTLAQWSRVVDTNLTGAFLCTQHAIRRMKAQSPQGGRIINNGSISAYAPRPHSAPYTATKHAMTGLTKSTALDGRPHNIACSQIDIGNAATEMTSRMSSGALQADGRTMAEPTIDVQHVADAIVHIANLSLDANILFMTLMATKMPFVGRG
jgi:NAD(P)-dependent dehydrogenase (short-subunit alcohol dehydrogenase family)